MHTIHTTHTIHAIHTKVIVMAAGEGKAEVVRAGIRLIVIYT